MEADSSPAQSSLVGRRSFWARPITGKLKSKYDWRICRRA
jgi:hypothetical protein